MVQVSVSIKRGCGAGTFFGPLLGLNGAIGQIARRIVLTMSSWTTGSQGEGRVPGGTGMAPRATLLKIQLARAGAYVLIPVSPSASSGGGNTRSTRSNRHHYQILTDQEKGRHQMASLLVENTSSWASGIKIKLGSWGRRINLLIFMVALVAEKALG